MCMAQFHRLLGSCRQPGIPRDTQHLPESQVSVNDDEHIIVMCRNQVLFLELLVNVSNLCYTFLDVLFARQSI